MSVSTKLNSMFSYSFLPIIIIFLFLIALFLINKSLKKKTIKEDIVIPSPENIALIKEKYLKEIDQLKKEFINNNFSLRVAYQNLSKVIRNFVFETTHIKVQNYTLDDIRKLNMPILYELISEYYNPEFANISNGNFIYSIEKARGVVEKWN